MQRYSSGRRTDRERKMARQAYPVAQPCNKTRSQIERLAEDFARQQGFSPGDRIEAFIAALGGRIEYLGTPESWTAEDGSLYVHGPGDFEILISAFTGPERDRFTIAHELGHYVLHSDAGEKPLKATRFGSTRPEWEANWFAASFLMPAEHFRQTCREFRNDADLVAARYLVSSRAAEVRMECLGFRD